MIDQLCFKPSPFLSFSISVCDVLLQTLFEKGKEKLREAENLSDVSSGYITRCSEKNSTSKSIKEKATDG